jgi:DNA helicase-2/ATP-dependent DNA helicase PcrA
LDVRNQNVDRFCLGLFGDMMQRIYPDGKHDLLDSIDETWVKPKLDINYRPPMRILTLINKIRTKTDGLEQKPHPDSQIEGTVRLFIAEASSKTDRAATEREVCEVMASATRDPAWRERQRSVKVLALEHHMVAQRAGFARFWESLNQAPKLKAGLPEGKLEGIPFFRDQVVPLISARRSNDGLAVARMVREHSLLLDYESLKSMSNPSLAIQQAKAAVECVFNLWQVWDDPPLSLVLERVHESGLFPIPDVFAPFVGRSGELYGDQDHQEHDSGSVLDAWREALDVPFSEVEKYVEYITDRSAYGTHQGVKGLEFPRVMVIADDGEAKGTVFSYEKVFGAKELSARDFENQAEGKETSLDRTMRLLYVTCSRAQKSLALVVYTANPHKVQGTALSNGWFSEDEIVMM